MDDSDRPETFSLRDFLGNNLFFQGLGLYLLVVCASHFKICFLAIPLASAILVGSVIRLFTPPLQAQRAAQ